MGSYWSLMYVVSATDMREPANIYRVVINFLSIDLGVRFDQWYKC